MTFNSRKANMSGGKLFYTALTLCLVALGLGIWGAVKAGVSPEIKEQSTTALTTQYDWDNVGIRDFTIDYDETEPEVEANVPVSGIPDSREELSEAVSEAQKTDFAMPMGDTIIKDYSGGEMVRSKTMRDWRVHNGIDFGDNRGQSVVAIQDGKIMQVYEDELWGTVVIIDHGDGLVAKYCGLSSDGTPEVGAEIEKHEIIGRLGEIPVEKADGPHLHLEITVDGELADPLKAMHKIN